MSPPKEHSENSKKIPPALTPATTPPAPAVGTCQATVKSTGKPCSSPAKDGNFCGRHSNGPAAVAATAPPPAPAVGTCQATVKSTVTPCTSSAKDGNFCGGHSNGPAATLVDVDDGPDAVEIPALSRVLTEELKHSTVTRLMPCQVPDTVRLASWNLLHLSKGTAHSKKAMRFIRRVLHEVDFCALQEIDCGTVIPDLVAKMGDEWEYCQKQISTKGGVGSAEHYAFVWRRSAVEYLHSDRDVSDLNKGGYIVAGVKDQAQANTFFHRPPLIATFRAKPDGMTFTAVTIHVTFDGRPNDFEPTKTEARKLETENLAALAYILEADLGSCGTDEVDRVIMMGDFNLPARQEYFQSLLGPVLEYVPCLNPETSAASMLSKGGVTYSPTAKKKKADNPGDYLYDNIIMSPPLRSVGGGGGDVLSSGVCDLVALVDDFTMPQIRGEVLDTNDLEYVKRVILKHCVSDHMPIYSDISVGHGYCITAKRGQKLRLPESHIRVVQTNGGKFGRQYSAISTVGTQEGRKRRAAKAKAAEKPRDDPAVKKGYSIP